ncbi:hypothetical protein JCM8097_002180 [Rhodosporidiobolus ruineniae]
MSLQPPSAEPEAKPSKSPLLRTAALDPNRRARSSSTHSFTLEIPVKRSTKGSSAAQPPHPTSSAMSSASPAPQAGPSKDATSYASTKPKGDQRVAAAGSSGGVTRIISSQKNAGMEETFLVLLDGRKVQRTRTALRDLAPSLLADFDAAHPSSSSDDSSEIVVMESPKKGRKAGKRTALRPTRAQTDEDEEMADASDEEEEEEEAESGPSSEGAAYSDGEEEEEEDELDDFIDDDLGTYSKKRRSKAKKPVAGERKSTRSGGRVQKHYDFGDGATRARSETDDDSGSSSSAGARQHGTRSSTRRSARASTGSTSTSGSGSGQGGDSGESSDELSIQPAARKSAPRPKKVSKAAVVADSSSEYADDGGEDDEEDELAASVTSSPRRKPQDIVERPQDSHRAVCAKCGDDPASELFRKFYNRKKKPGRKKRRDELMEDTDAEEDRLTKLGAWVECGVCCSAYHFGCLPAPRKRDITDKLKAEHAARFSAEPTPGATGGETDSNPAAGASASASTSRASSKTASNLPPREKIELDVNRTFSLPKCPACKKQGGRKCLVCGISGKKVTEREVEELGPRIKAKAVKEGEEEGQVDVASRIKPGLMFRCTKCKRVAHYGCLKDDEPEWTFQQHCQSYLDYAVCYDCYHFSKPLDAILFWAEADPLPNAGKDDVDSDDEAVEHVAGEKRYDEKTKKTISIPSAKDPLANAKYLVKWQQTSYRHLDWVPHAWLVAAYPAKLTNFLARGSTVSFEPAKEDEAEDGASDADGDDEDGDAPLPDPNALDRIPKSWTTVDRLLEVLYHHPKRPEDEVRHEDYVRRYDLPEDPAEAAKLIAICKVKWGDLPYNQSTDEWPLEPDDEGYEAFLDAYKAYVLACDPKMSVPALSKSQMKELDQPRSMSKFKELKEQPDFITGGKLMDFQLSGINFLRYQWWQRTGCILADEMGLGKTCQIISFLSCLFFQEGARPFLIAVPNSLVGNWMREFARWAPKMRVVPYNGDAESRQMVEEYELFDSHGSLKTHVVLVTYEALQANARVFRRVGRWECIVIDEGQRLKSGKDGLLYQAIDSLNISQRILLSGTPLNNNLREVFNLLAFINPRKFPDVEGLTARFAELTRALVEEVREMLKPHFLRRTKNLVLNLPPLTDIVVPVSMTVLQRSIYRGILERNASAIQSVIQSAGSKKKKAKSGSFANILMELRKSLVHPYLVSADIEPGSTTPEQAHFNLTEASAKFVLLQRMLPKLKAAGHRVLIFSQFKIALNIIERFLSGLKLKYLRLDGDTPQLERQRDVDKYNAPGSEYFAYLLSTRAGGVGLNITSADIVIIYDQDFNPQMDLQAISRAHRIGQTKPVRVFKLLVKGTCEEKIFNAGNKKLGLEHLIIQRIDAVDEEEDMQSMLQFGAQAVFDEEAAQAAAIRYNDEDIDELLKKTAEPTAQETDAAGAFAQAQVWVREKGGLDDAATLEKETEKAEEGKDLHDFWSKVVGQQQEVERQNKLAQAANVGRGKRKRGQVNYRVDVAPSPNKGKGKQKERRSTSPLSEALSSGDEYRQRRDEIESDDEWHEPMEVDELPDGVDPLRAPPPLARTLPAGADPTSDKKRRKLDTPAQTEAEMLAILQARELKRQEQSNKAQATIDKLMRSAINLDDDDVMEMLVKARMATRTEQTRLCKLAAEIIRHKTKELKQGRPLIPLPAVANQPHIASTPLMSTSTTASKSAAPGPLTEPTPIAPLAKSTAAAAPAISASPAILPKPQLLVASTTDAAATAATAATTAASASSAPSLSRKKSLVGRPPSRPVSRSSTPVAIAPRPASPAVSALASEVGKAPSTAPRPSTSSSQLAAASTSKAIPSPSQPASSTPRDPSPKRTKPKPASPTRVAPSSRTPVPPTSHQPSLSSTPATGSPKATIDVMAKLNARKEKRVRREQEEARRRAEEEKEAREKQAALVKRMQREEEKRRQAQAADELRRGKEIAANAALRASQGAPPSSGSSSGGSTPRLSQTKLSFAKKPSPPSGTANAAASSSQPRSSSTIAAPSKRPSPSSSSQPAKRPSPSSSSQPAKRPSLAGPSTSSSAIAADAPPKKRPSLAGKGPRPPVPPKQKKETEVIVISDSE